MSHCTDAVHVGWVKCQPWLFAVIKYYFLVQ